eukprot:TRINITY_DN1099_c0_g1_i18.p1 TRINITY_DN1099_c0_g1~~TRINITY_DN1099_c0_g1_i18.p1  ORF type:complete len:169 (-),score=58.74 TRINITY_DN1099_c0_g1_i18:185-691(-)
MAKFAALVAAAAAVQTGHAYVAPAGPAAYNSELSAPKTFAQVHEGAAFEGQAAGSSAFNPLAIGAALGLMAAVVTSNAPAAKAADIENGSSVFAANCTACHAGGKNNVKQEKTLFPDALKANNRYEISDMITWISSGGNGMPNFGERLGPDDIEDVANYVRGQADKGW